MHTSVFLEEAIASLNIQKKGKYIDATYGKGGHSRAIVEKGGDVLAIEWDPSQIPSTKQTGIEIAKGNFANIQFIAQEYKFIPVDGILFDFGLSMDQLEEGKKGLSFRKLEEPLDMRISNEGITAAEIINEYAEHELADAFMKFSEEIKSAAIAKQIGILRRKKPLQKVQDLNNAIDKALKELSKNREFTEKVYARIYQALRIMVNEEFNNINKGLEDGLSILSPGGRIVTITFHSLEDRIVKLFARQHKAEVIEEKIDVEKARKLRSFERSATLRILEKKLT
ncbi:MAG TPA: 16S rRNA (cytosine(1402)-N(4))-methyltransferase RsmH [Candidatus Woesebacteria bacterium]|nr:16S rRNA (cytosine(1402)-N(4))-methyltransferase RsmH [Candidatus Woesebacteria bacterium]